MQRAHPRIAAPGELHRLGDAHANHLVVEDVRRHPDEGEVAAALTDDLVARGIGDQVREPLQGYAVAVAHGGDRLIQLLEDRQRFPDLLCDYRSHVLYAIISA